VPVPVQVLNAKAEFPVSEFVANGVGVTGSPLYVHVQVIFEFVPVDWFASSVTSTVIPRSVCPVGTVKPSHVMIPLPLDVIAVPALPADAVVNATFPLPALPTDPHCASAVVVLALALAAKSKASPPASTITALFKMHYSFVCG
jgi:hypothetical protein